MAENNKSYRIRTKVGREADSFLNVKLDQDYDSLEILSLKISDKDTYRLHNSDYGVIVGRVLANGNFGVPNAKISVFIPADGQNTDLERWNLYPYTSTSTKNYDGVRYNLLPDASVKDCHKAVGTFPHKTYLLENESLLEVFDDYYVYTTRTNAAGDYLICGVPTGMQTLHMDLDLSDCGILSQRPRDFVYKGYTIEQFENPNQFKKDENIDGLSQIFSQNQPVYVQPFWGNEDNGEEIGITRADIEIAFKFEPTCVFMGSAVSDNASNGIGKKCVPTDKMGSMDELTAGEGTIEMIRKTPGGNVEEFSIKGNQVINGDGIWCYQIPMNLDYMMTDEYGNMVPTDDPEKGIPTRTRVRFRASLSDMENNTSSYYRAKYLIPNNPRIDDAEVDYNFGTYTKEDSFRDLFWNGVYTVKSYIPRFQKSKRWRSERFSGIKSCNFYGSNNPMPYNNLRIKLPLVFTVLCVFVKMFITIVTLINRLEAGILRIFLWFPEHIGLIFTGDAIAKRVEEYNIHCVFVGDGLCPDMEGWYFAPGCAKNINTPKVYDALISNTLEAAKGDTGIESSEFVDETSLDYQNTPTSQEQSVCLTMNVDFLLNCFEMALAKEFRVINFDFYNDWVNGVLYFPRWMRKVKRKKRYRFSFKNGISSYFKDKVQGCMSADNSSVKKSRYYTQQCSMAYAQKGYNSPYNIVNSEPTCYDGKKRRSIFNFIAEMSPSKCHKKQGMTNYSIFGKKSGLVTEETTKLGQYVYYLKPCEWKTRTETNDTKRVLLFATDIVLLGTLNDCDENGIPQTFKYLSSSSYIMPTNLALTTLDDESYIYTTSGGSVCSSVKNESDSPKKPVSNVTMISPDFKSTAEAYSKTDGDEVVYQDYDDPIPVTETAGIAWDYSGPGQDDENLGKIIQPDAFIKRLFGDGNKRLKYLYYPGGHFLGMSCINSETNIKSCVNLKRICELGASMSQRREEIRGYDSNGKPKYRYYVPTGLITNVDIESASFRAMFATINHNRLIANRTNEETGYKTYTFRFLRPDGFDGALQKYVHQPSSPYNKKVNDGSYTAITDSTSFFKRNFPDWLTPEDYDPNELEYTERRTVEDTINDYYMFRFGLDTFSDREQKSHFLSSNTYGLLMPQYENSFYFYFGLKDGATAIDEFKKQFYSDCEANVVMKEPYLTVEESFNDDLSEPRAIVTINNMIAPYSIVITDNTLGKEVVLNAYTADTFDVGNELGYAVSQGSEYMISVTDAMEHTVKKVFTFGSGSIKGDFETIPFRYKATNASSNRNPKLGGFLKIDDEITILGKKYSITESSRPGATDTIQFGIREIINGRDSSAVISPLNEHQISPYEDENGNVNHLYEIPKIGTFRIYIKFNGGDYSPAYIITVNDNSDVELYTSCNYLGYKTGYGLSGITDNNWMNSASVFGQANLNGWLMRHSFYRQTQNDTIGYDHHLYASGKNSVAVFGQPENIESLAVTPTADMLKAETVSQRDYMRYEGYSLDDKNSFIPTLYWKGQERRTFDAMAYSDNGLAAADVLSDISITNYTFSDSEGKITLAFTGSNNKLVVNHGCLVVMENGTILFPVVTSIRSTGGTMVAYSETDAYLKNPNLSDQSWNKLLSMAAVYPTMRVPSFYKPFYGDVDVILWNHERLTVYKRTITGGGWYYDFNKEELPFSHMATGTIHNGLTYNNRFYGQTGENYETYFINNKSDAFYNALTGETSSDYLPDVSHQFSFSDEVTNANYDEESVDYYDVIEYQVTENTPTGTLPSGVKTERYSGDFDKNVLYDSCSVTDCFYDDLSLIVNDSDLGITGECTLHTDKDTIDGTSVYVVKTEIFEAPNAGTGPGAAPFIPLMTQTEDGLVTAGYYNHNIELASARGKQIMAKVTPNYTNFVVTFEVPSDSDTSIYETVEVPISKAESSGFTIYREFAIKESVRDNLLGTIRDAITRSDTIRPFESTGNTFKPSEYNAVVQVYEKPDDGTKNKMRVYKLTPIMNMAPSFYRPNNPRTR